MDFLAVFSLYNTERKSSLSRLLLPFYCSETKLINNLLLTFCEMLHNDNALRKKQDSQKNLYFAELHLTYGFR